MKKQSDAKPPDGTVFFIDRSLGKEPIRTELINAGLVVEIHDDHFVRDEEDRVWLRTVGERGWVVLTKDQRLRNSPLEIAALRASKARVFVLIALPHSRRSAKSCIPAGTIHRSRHAGGTRKDHLISVPQEITWKRFRGVVYDARGRLWSPSGVQTTRQHVHPSMLPLVWSPAGRPPPSRPNIRLRPPVD